MAITAAKPRKEKNGNLAREESYVVASGQTIPQGALVSINTSTREAYNGTDAASRAFVGLAQETVVGDGVLTIKVKYGHDALLTINANITDASVNKNVSIEDNDQVDTNTARTNDVMVGVVRKLESASTAWIGIRIPGFSNT